MNYSILHARTYSRTGSTILLSALALLLFSCKKNTTTISIPQVQVGQLIQSGNISGAIKGTMKADSTYEVTGDITINAGDTLVIQPGARVYFKGNYFFWIKGNLFSLGTQADPVYFSVQNITKEDNPNTPIATDPAYQGLWGGLQGDTTCQNIVLKWTHLEFGGGVIGTPQVAGLSSGDNAFVIFFQNPNGNLIMEDSWLYGATDDAIRIKTGKFDIMRNTFEKAGPGGGDCINVKGGGIGNSAYNLFIGCATNGPKASDKGQPVGADYQTNCYYYNNTIVNGGYKDVELGRGGSINFEEGAKGLAYNNLIVNCKFGLRVVGATQAYLGNALVVADTAHIQYGNTYNYSDSVSGCDQFYPVTPPEMVGGSTPVSGLYTAPQTSDIPDILSLLPTGYLPGDPYDGSGLARKNNPEFVNFPLPEAATPESICYTSGYDFHLQASSPAIGKGYTGFQPLSSVPVGGNFGATELTPPGSDIGAYQSNGQGNQH